MRRSTFPVHHWLALGLVFFSFFMTALVSDRVFEQVPHLEDEVAYLFEAKLLAQGKAVIDSPQPSRPFWQPFVIDHEGKRFGKYPLGWPATLAVGVALGQPWIVNAFLAAMTVALVYRLGSETFNRDVGLIAAALTAFSPMALLLNATLMGHAAALFCFMLLVYAYWRLEKGRYRLRWGLVAGFALGMTLINRPLAGVAVAAPFIAWSVVRLLRALWLDRQQTRLLRTPLTGEDAPPRPSPSLMQQYPNLVSTLVPLLALGVVTLLLATVIPLYQYATTGDARQNLYLLVWSYDRVGFGEGYGAHGHTLEKGIRQTGWDLSLTASDLFGWQTGSMFTADNQIKPELADHLLNQGDYWPPTPSFGLTLPSGNNLEIPFIGLSWVLLPFGLFIGFRKRWWWWAAWLALGAVGLIITSGLNYPALGIKVSGLPTDQLRDPQFAIIWMAGYVVWMCIPFLFLLLAKPEKQSTWTWLLFAIALSLIGLHITYWIGSQRYSTRYYYEALAPLALISALPVVWLMKRVGRFPVYLVFAAVLVYTLFAYTQPRIEVLYRFNWISPALVDAVEQRREGDRPVLVLVTGSDVRWRAYGSLTVITSPTLDSDIVVAWDTGASGVREAILSQFPDRQVIEMDAVANKSCFVDNPADCYGEVPQVTVSG
ncbi:MAG: glycosyltransferase family 39 protein [Chloroflexi bacterium]|nr:glycosyltransferase family 39 protein [Chloroflexota bacterium]MCC6893998.1 glycosyltransferase family 39 protein [Anaerolineae bacterium]